MSLRETVGVAADAQRIHVRGVELAVAREGAGPPVVCLHAIGHGGGDFTTFAALMRDRFEVIRIDWPGQGRSGDDAEPASARRYAELLGGALAALGIERPILIGNSIGGAAALVHAARAPVRALVLCDPGGLVAVDGMVRRICGLFARFFRAGARGAWWFPAAFALFYRVVLPSPAARGQRRLIVAAVDETAPILVQAWESFSRPEADIRALAAGLDIPVWFAWSKSDQVARFSLCQLATAAMRRATVTQFKGGHAAFPQQPQAFAAAFERFAAGLLVADPSATAPC